MKLGFIITGYDQRKEIKFSHHMLRNLWAGTKESLISIVISGDPTRSVSFKEPRTRVTNLDNMVTDFNKLVSTSIAKQMRHGMIELMDLEREFGPVDFIAHFHGDILLLNEQGFMAELERFAASSKLIACDTVGPQRSDYIEFTGREIMPQLFVVKRNVGYFFDNMEAPQTPNEKKSTEHMLLSNLIQVLSSVEFGRPDEENISFEIDHLFDSYVHEVQKHRPKQWGVHDGFWGGWTHFGQTLHFSKEQREHNCQAALAAYGVDISAW